MEFLTLHQLSRELDKPEKTLRYRFNQLKFENKLVEGEDYIRDDFVDENHFTYKINPVTFIQKTGLTRIPIPANQLGTQMGTKEPEIDTNRGNQKEETVTKSDTNVGTNSLPPDMAADFIAVLKEQLRVKDEQLKRATEQVKDLQEINNMAMGEVVQLNRTVRQLAAPKFDTNGYQEGQVVDSKVDTNGYQNGYQTGTNINEPTTQTATPESVGGGGR
jgi:hypothetical protein